MGNVVLPEHRRRGLGRAFLERCVAAARAHGSEVLAAGVEEGDVAGEAFAARYGLREVLRELEISRPRAAGRAGARAPRRNRARRALDPARPPAGRLRPRVRDAARDAAPCASRDAVVRAVDRGGRDRPGRPRRAAPSSRSTRGQVVGFSGLIRRAADPHLAEHGLTSVTATHRNRGIATALKRAQIAWASRSGYRELMTSTQVENAPMRAVNDKLGYEPRPAWIRVEGALEEVEAALARERGLGPGSAAASALRCRERSTERVSAPAFASAARAAGGPGGSQARRRGSRCGRRASR